MCNDGQEYVRDSQSRPGVYATRSVAARVAEVHGAARAAARSIAAARRWAWGGPQPARKSARRDHSLRSVQERGPGIALVAGPPTGRRTTARPRGTRAGPRGARGTARSDGVVTGGARGKNARLERNNESDRAHARAPAVAVRRGRRRSHDPYARGAALGTWAAGPENARAATQPKSEQGVHTTTKLSPRRRSRARERSREQEVPVAVVSLTNHELPCVQ